MRRRPAPLPAVLALSAAVAACAGGEGGVAPTDRPLLTVAPDPLVMLNETQQRLALVTREQRSLRRLSFWLVPDTGSWPVSVDAEGVVTAANTGRATIAIAVEADGVDTNAYVPVVVRGLRRPSLFGAPGDTVRLWLGERGAPEQFHPNPLVYDTVAVAQSVRWTSGDSSVLAVAPETSPYEGAGVHLSLRAPGRTTLTVQSTAVPTFVLRRPVTVGRCLEANSYGCTRGELPP